MWKEVIHKDFTADEITKQIMADCLSHRNQQTHVHFLH